MRVRLRGTAGACCRWDSLSREGICRICHIGSGQCNGMTLFLFDRQYRLRIEIIKEFDGMTHPTRDRNRKLKWSENEHRPQNALRPGKAEEAWVRWDETGRFLPFYGNNCLLGGCPSMPGLIVDLQSVTWSAMLRHLQPSCSYRTSPMVPVQRRGVAPSPSPPRPMVEDS